MPGYDTSSGEMSSAAAPHASLSRWLPILGPVLIGGYSLMDTPTVGKTAIDTFSRQIEIEPGLAAGEAGPVPPSGAKRLHLETF